MKRIIEYVLITIFYFVKDAEL